MQNTQEVTRLALLRARQLRKRRKKATARVAAWLAGGTAALGLCLSLVLAWPGAQGAQTIQTAQVVESAQAAQHAAWQAGILAAGQGAGGYVLVGVICFALGAAAVLLAKRRHAPGEAPDRGTPPGNAAPGQEADGTHKEDVK